MSYVKKLKCYEDAPDDIVAWYVNESNIWKRIPLDILF